MNQIENTLIELTNLLNSNHINWALGGSCMLKLRGIELDVNDIDIMIHESDFEKCIELLNTVSMECEVKKSDVFKTRYYKKFKWNQTEIDCLSGMSIQLGLDLFEYQFDHKVSDIYLNGTVIPLCYIEDWFMLYQLMPNRGSKIIVIDEYFKSHMINKNRIQHLLDIKLPNQIREYLENYVKQ